MLVVLVFWGLTFSHQHELSPKVVESSKCFCAQIPYFFPNLKLIFIVIVVVRLCLAHSNCCSLTENMIRRAPMGTICRPSDYGSMGTETTAFIQCINGRDPQINELWCLGLDGIFREVHPTKRTDIPDGTIR